MRYGKLIFILLGCISAWSSLAQSDTLFIRFENRESNKLIEGFRNKNDTSDVYPFGGGRIYLFGKMRKGRERIADFTFSFFTTTLEGNDRPFSYQKVNESALGKKIFKDRAWFDKTSYVDIIKYFGRKEYGDQIIMLYDETQPPSDKVYLVRVYFSFEAEE